MSDDTMRAAFEKWAELAGMWTNRASRAVWPDEYQYIRTENAWKGWKAALAWNAAKADATPAESLEDCE